MALRRDMLEVIEQGGWLMPGTDPMDGIADPAKGCAEGDPEYTDVYCEVYKLSRFTARATGRKCWKDLEVVPRGIPAARLSARHICPFSVRPRSRLAGFLPMRYYVA